jgi:uncharacterized protein (TIGR02679 family)
VNRHERLQRLLGASELVGLRMRLRRYYERGAISPVLHLRQLTEAERSALAALLGRPPSLAKSMRVDVAALDAALEQARLANSLRGALEALDGPIADRAAESVAIEVRWRAVLERCGEQCRTPLLAALLADAAGFGLLKRMAGGDPGAAMRLCELTQRVLMHLPAKGIPRAKLAADALGDAHGLDDGRPVATLVSAALKRQFRDALADDVERNESARAIWAGAGVMVNELSRPALFLNLPGKSGSALPGQPDYLSLRTLLRSPPTWQVAGREVFVCENPNLLAIAADALGARCASLVCTDGMPSAAQRTLMRQLADAGANLRYHGDYDWPGVQIGNAVMRAFDAQPWRYGAQDYGIAVARAKASHDSFRPLGPTIVDASWDSDLAQIMQRHGRAIDEEAIAEILLADLSTDDA